MFGFRYHLSTLVALFLMLGIGITIGSTSRFGPALARRQEALIHTLDDRLTRVLQESDAEHQLLRQNEDALQGLVPGLVAERLAGWRVAVVRTGDYPAAVQDVTDAVTAAGGQVVSTTTLTERLAVITATQRAALMRSLHHPGPSAGGGAASAGGSDPGSVAPLLHPLALLLRDGSGASSDAQSDLDILTSGGYLETAGDYTQPVRAVVVVGGEEGDAVATDGAGQDQGVMAALRLVAAPTAAPQPPRAASAPPDPSGAASGAGGLGSGVTAAAPPLPVLVVVGCEPYDAAVSSIPSYIASGASTVDCIDLPIGQLDLPYALRSDAPVAYGIKASATRRVPAALEQGASAG